MTRDQREIQRKLRMLRHAEQTGYVAKTCRYFGVGRSSFYHWRQAYTERGEAGLINARAISEWHANRTPPEREEKVLYLRRKYHLGPMRIVWYLARYHDIKISDATVSRILRRKGFSQLPSYKGDVDHEANLDEWQRFYNFRGPVWCISRKNTLRSLKRKAAIRN